MSRLFQFQLSYWRVALTADWEKRRKKKTKNSLNEACTFIFWFCTKRFLFLLVWSKLWTKVGKVWLLKCVLWMLLYSSFFLVLSVFFSAFFFFLLHTHVLKPTLIQSFTSFFFNYFPFLQCDTHPFLYVDRIEKWKLGDQDKEGTEEKRKKYCQRSRRQLISTWYTTPLLQFFFFFFWLWLLFFFFSLKGKTRSFPPFVSGTRCVELTGPLPAWKQSRWLSAL